MSEYIVTCDEEVAEWIGNDVDSMKPIVRCRDCRYYKRGDDGWWCLRSISTRSNHHDGFCAWGEPRGDWVTCKCGEEIEATSGWVVCPSCGRRWMNER